MREVLPQDVENSTIYINKNLLLKGFIKNVFKQLKSTGKYFAGYIFEAVSKTYYLEWRLILKFSETALCRVVVMIDRYVAVIGSFLYMDLHPPTGQQSKRMGLCNRVSRGAKMDKIQTAA